MTGRAASFPISCCHRSPTMPPSAASCRKSPPAPMSRRSTASFAPRSNRPADGFADLDAVAATAGPGLIGGVLVGLTTAKAIALAAGKPLIAVNHLEGHALTARLTDGLAVSLSPAAGLRRPQPVRRGGRRRPLPPPRHDHRRRARRGLRQGRQAARPALSRRPRGRAGGEDRRSEALRPAAPADRPAGRRFLLLRPEDRRAPCRRSRRAAFRPGRRRPLRLLPGGGHRRRRQPRRPCDARLPRQP